MKRATAIALAFFLGIGIGFLPRTFGQAPAINNGQPGFQLGSDPCQSNGIAKSSIVLNITSATTTQLVALSAGKQIFVCGFNFTMVGTVQTLAFEYGTGASCGTGTTLLTGAMADGTVSDIVVGMYPGSTVMT